MVNIKGELLLILKGLIRLFLIDSYFMPLQKDIISIISNYPFILIINIKGYFY